MAIYARKKEGDYTVCPEGLYQAVCVDVFDLGLKDYGYGPQPKIEITWQLEERDPKTNKRYLIFANYTPSLHEKSRLRPMLEAWRGKKFTKDEEREFDIEKLLGANCQLQIIHNIKDEGKTYANVQAVVPLHKGTPRILGEDYIRRIDREKQYDNHPDGEHQAVNGHATDEYVPF